MSVKLLEMTNKDTYRSGGADACMYVYRHAAYDYTLVWNFSTVQPFNSSTFFYTHDGNKNVSEVIASDTDVAAHYEYAPFGALTVSRGVSAAANPWRFSSEYAEDDTATVYYNYRHYEPVTGRWLQRDPIGDFAVAYYIASVGSESQKMWILNSSSELRNQLVRNRTLRRLLGFSQRKKISIGKETAVLLYVVANNDLINNLDERGAVAQWLAGCGIGACWGGIGGLAASALGGLRSAVCGLASGAISGCAAGWACSTLNPQICLAGSCVGGFLGAIANTMCSNGESLKDGCAWASAILSSSLSCISGLAGPASFKEKLVTFVLGVDVSAWSAKCDL